MRLSDLHEKISFKRVKRMWADDTYPLKVYVHSPFCSSICKYCYYKGVPFNKAAYQRYYYEYLPRVIRMYNDILEVKKIQSYFFGGGTPSLMSPETMRHVFSCFPKSFKRTKEKLFEIHPAHFSPEQISILKEYNFSTIIIGIQTFDRETLKRQNRTPYSFSEVQEIARLAHQTGMRVALDLIVFLNRDARKDVPLFKKDIKKCFELSPEEISIQNDYRLKKHDEKFDERVVELVFDLIQMKSGEYVSEESKAIYMEGEFARRKCLRIYKASIKRDKQLLNEYWRGMDENTKLAKNMERSVLGIGSYKNARKNTFSNVGDYIEYIEVNEDWKPAFYLVHQHDYFREVDLLMQKIKKLGQPPKGIEFVIGNVMNVEREETIYRKPRDLALSVNYDHKSHVAYVEKLQKLMST